MEPCQLSMALLVPDDGLQHFSQLKTSFINQKETSRIGAAICLHLIEPNGLQVVGTVQQKLTSESNTHGDAGQQELERVRPLLLLVIVSAAVVVVVAVGAFFDDRRGAGGHRELRRAARRHLGLVLFNQ